MIPTLFTLYVSFLDEISMEKYLFYVFFLTSSQKGVKICEWCCLTHVTNNYHIEIFLFQWDTTNRDKYILGIFKIQKHFFLIIKIINNTKIVSISIIKKIYELWTTLIFTKNNKHYIKKNPFMLFIFEM